MRARRHVLQTVLLTTLAVLVLAVLSPSVAQAIPTGTLVCTDAGHPDYFWRVDVETGSATKIDVGVYCGIIRWSQDGEWLTFYGGQAYHADIYVVRPDGTGFRDLTNDSMDLFTPSFSPDGQQVLFNDMAGRLYTINFDGTGRALVPGTGGMHHPQWSPVDSNRIVYSNWSVTYQSDIFVYDMDSGTSAKIADHGAAGVRAFHSPTWSPDGRMVAMTGIDDSNSHPYDIWVVSADGSDDPVNLTAAWPDTSESSPSWSPDGQYIFFASDRDGDYDIWAIRSDGSGPMEKIYGRPGVDEQYPAITGPSFLMVEIDINPDTLNLRSRGRFITAYVELPEGYDPADIDVGTVCLAVEGSDETVSAEPRPTAVRDHDRDGVDDLMVKFDRQAVQELLSAGEEEVVYVGGLLVDGTEFLGADTVRVIDGEAIDFFRKAADANRAACLTEEKIYQSLTSRRGGRALRGTVRRCLRLVERLLRMEVPPGLGPPLEGIQAALVELEEWSREPFEPIRPQETAPYTQARQIAMLFDTLAYNCRQEARAWQGARSGRSGFSTDDVRAWLEAESALLGMLSDAVDDFREQASSLPDAGRAQHLVDLADTTNVLLSALGDYLSAVQDHVDTW